MSSEVYSDNIMFPNNVVVKVDSDKVDGSFAKLSVFPLQKGFGITIGNIFRRTLLSSIRGVAIDKIKFTDVVHEYSVIDGVIQKMPEIVYNLRKIIFSTDIDSINFSCSFKGPKKVYASDLVLPSGVSIVNKDQFLFEIVANRNIDIDFFLIAGIGDIFVDSDKKNEMGFIYFDKHFSPVTSVSAFCEQTSVNGKTDYDKLVMDIRTNGSISAENAFRTSISILKNFISSIDELGLNIVNANLKSGVSKQEVAYNYNLLKKVTSIEMSVRSLNCLQNAGIEYLGDLVNIKETDMLRMPNFGRKSLNELKAILEQNGLSFDMNIEWPPKNIEQLLLEAKNI